MGKYRAVSVAAALPALSLRQRTVAALDRDGCTAAVAAAVYVRAACSAAAKTLQRSMPGDIAAALAGGADGADAVLEWALSLPPRMAEPQRTDAGAAAQNAANLAFFKAVKSCGGPDMI